MEKKSRYDNLSSMTMKDLEEELNFFTFLEELVDITMSKEMRLRNKMWLDSVWIEIKRRGYSYEKVYKLDKSDSEN